MSSNAVFVMSIIVAAVLVFLAPQATYLAWLCLAFARLMLTALVLGLAHEARAASGGLVASNARNLRNVQVLLPGLNQKRNDSLNCWSCP